MRQQLKVEASTALRLDLAESIPGIGLRFEGQKLWVALPNDFSELDINKALADIRNSGLTEIEYILVPREIILEQISIVYFKVDTQSLVSPGVFELRNEKTVVDTVNNLIATAIKSRASDIHIEPQENSLAIRIRVDGKLENLAEMESAFGPAIISRLKVLAKMSIVERRRPQDGQFNFEILDKNIDLRLSTIATLYGEKIEIRILDTARNLGGLVSLGMSKNSLEKLTNLLQAGQGLIIAAGPTGSGKSTTMHSALQIVNSPELNVSTIEDPVEYVIPGINHIPINESADLTFATQLRALLRQDPDVILVGEIRDSETARIAVQAALAGRLVLTTLHAQNAVGAIYRLFQMGIEPYQVAASLVGVVSQRLIRRTCDYCTVKDEVSPAIANYIKRVTKLEELKLQKGTGCTVCRNTGFFDRVGAFQLFEINEPIRELISQRPSPTHLEQASRKFGLLSLKEETLLLAAKGFTSVSEVLSVIEDIKEPENEFSNESNTIQTTQTKEVAEPVKVEVAEPVKVEVAEPVKVEVAEPVKVEVAEPVKVEVAEPAKVEVAEPVKVEKRKVLVKKPATTKKSKVLENKSSKINVGKPEKAHVSKVLAKKPTKIKVVKPGKVQAIKDLVKNSTKVKEDKVFIMEPAVIKKGWFSKGKIK